MSDSSIPSDVDQDTFELRLAARRQRESDEEKRLLDSFQGQSEWYRLHGGTLLCDCSNCINARKLKASLPKQPDISQPDIIQRKIPDIRPLFRFLPPSDEDITTSD